MNISSEDNDPLEQNSAFNAMPGSIFKELEIRLIHNHPLFRCNNATLFSMLEETTRSKISSPTVKPFNRTKYGRAAYYTLTNSHTGQDKWERILKE